MINILGEEYDINITTILNLSYEHLTEMPESIGLLINLEILRLNYNNLTNISESIGML